MRQRQRLAAVMVAGLLVAYAGLTVRQIAVWRNSLSMWTAVLLRTPGSVTAHNNLSSWFADQQRPVEAVEQARLAIQASTSSAASRNAEVIGCMSRSLLVRSLITTGQVSTALGTVREVLEGPCLAYVKGRQAEVLMSGRADGR